MLGVVLYLNSSATSLFIRQFACTFFREPNELKSQSVEELERLKCHGVALPVPASASPREAWETTLWAGNQCKCGEHLGAARSKRLPRLVVGAPTTIPTWLGAVWYFVTVNLAMTASVWW